MVIFRKDFVDDFDYTVYEQYPDYFSIKLHHGGEFCVKDHHYVYVRGKVKYVDLINMDKFSVFDLNDIVEELGYDNKAIYYYHYLVPGSGLDFGLRALGNDRDILRLMDDIKDNKCISVYIEHDKTRLLTYFVSPTKPSVVLKEIEEGDTSNRVFTNRQLLGWKSVDLENSGSSTQQELLNNVDLPENEHMVNDVEGVQRDWIDDLLNDVCWDRMDHLINENDGNIVQPVQKVNEKGKSILTVEPCDENETIIEAETVNADEDEIIDEVNKIDEVDVDMMNFKVNFNEATHRDEGAENDEFGEEETLSNDSFGTSSSDEEYGIEKLRRKSLRKLRKQQQGCIFYVGQQFGNNDEVKSLIRRHAVETRREIGFYRIDQDKIRAVCNGPIPHFEESPDEGPSKSKRPSRSKEACENVGPGSKSKKDGGRHTLENPNKCPWVLYVSRVKDEPTWMVVTYNPQHKCLQSRVVKAFTAKWLSKEILMDIRSNPNIPIKAIQEQMQRKFSMSVSKMKAFRAKTLALEQVVGDYNKQYSILRDYLLELKRTNPNTTAKVDVEPNPNPASETRVFRRVYICLGPLKEGYKLCKREILGFDGAFMKGPYPGQLLTAVGMDPNNGIYPLAYAIVEAETRESWTWFLDNLRDDLDLQVSTNYTFITDRQKGLIPTIEEVFPRAEHRYCVRHIHQNMKLRWRGKAYKDMLWSIASATTVQEFGNKMEELRLMNPDTYQWLKAIDPVHWARSHFTGRAKTDVLLNNLCEVFNSRLVDGRDKPIITALEFVREYLMKRIVNVCKVIEPNKDGFLTPNIKARFDIIKDEASNLTAQWNGGSKYQVASYNGEQYVVDVVQKTCTCRRWELVGIPCAHAVASIWDMANNGERAEIPEKWVDSCYWISTWIKVYSHKIEPINGRTMWPKSGCPSKLIEPKHHKPIGRPRKMRKKDAMEKEDNMVKGGKLSRKWKTVTCGKCGNKGHNKKTCTGQGGASSSRERSFGL